MSAVHSNCRPAGRQAPGRCRSSRSIDWVNPAVRETFGEFTEEFPPRRVYPGGSRKGDEMRAIVLVGLLLAGRVDDEIFAVSPVYSLLPDGSVSERADGDLGELKRKNGHFDGATRTIRLYGAQNEEIAVQIVIPFAGEGFHAASTAIGVIPADRVMFSLIAYDKVGSRLQPDVIVPLDGSVAGLRSFDVPLRIKGLPEPGNRQGMILMEAWIPRAAPPGLQTGTVTILRGE